MITSTAPGHILDRLRRIAGPNPEGSHLTDAERLHLIYLLTVMAAAVQNVQEAALGHQAVDMVYRQLRAHGMSSEDITAVCDLTRNTNPAALADAIAVHPSLRSADYLD